MTGMAEARAIPSFGGYDDEFVDEVKDDWHCPICQLPLKEPVQTVVCGHRFCRQCLDSHFVRQERDDQQLTCPVDRNCVIKDKDIFPDKAVERMILSFIIKCPCAGCEWTGELRTKTAHQNECKRFPLDCPNSCGEFIPREEIPAHVEKDCTITVMPCPYAQMGCAAVVQRKEVETHLQSDVRLHLDLACTKFSDMQKELINTKEVLRNTQDELRNTQVELRLTQEQFCDTQEELHYTQETTRKLEEKIYVLENKPLRCQNLFTWKISGFHEILTQAKTGRKPKIQSVPFYIGECSYKLRMRLYPNGIGSGKNNFLSVFALLMKGEYDSILNWPFRQKVTVRLIDQQEEPDDRKNIVKSLSPGSGNEEWRMKPVEEESSGRGFTNFVSHVEMRERRYIVDDTMFIQVQFFPPQQVSVVTQQTNQQI